MMIYIYEYPSICLVFSNSLKLYSTVLFYTNHEKINLCAPLYRPKIIFNLSILLYIAIYTYICDKWLVRKFLNSKIWNKKQKNKTQKKEKTKIK